MKMTKRRFGLIFGMVAVYFSVIAIGIRLTKLPSFQLGEKLPQHDGMWHRPSIEAISDPKRRDSVHRGELLFDETPLAGAKYTHAKIACSSCHAEGGIQPFASPMVGTPMLFPMYSQRAGHKITLKDRIEECFVRSENGTPLDYNSPDMTAIVDYIVWLSERQPDSQPYVRRGLVNLPDLKPDPVHGAEIYSAQCAGCHGDNGEGNPYLFPPLWGEGSFNDGAGMYSIRKMAAFVQHNMPQNRMGILTPQEAYDVSAFIHNQPRPKFNKAYGKF